MAEPDRSQLIEEAIASIASLRKEGAHLHSITNTVAQNFTANVLLACGATVSMTSNPEEIEDFVGKADALHINLGTLDDARMQSIRRAVSKANERQITITLDPVMVHVSVLRLSFAHEVLGNTSIVKGNSSEIKCVTTPGLQKACIVETGETDRVFFDDQTVLISNGHPMLSKVIATGCALGALITILTAKTPDKKTACVAALLWVSIAGEIAAERAAGPGSFQYELLDALATISLDDIRERAKVEYE